MQLRAQKLSIKLLGILILLGIWTFFTQVALRDRFAAKETERHKDITGIQLPVSDNQNVEVTRKKFVRRERDTNDNTLESSHQGKEVSSKTGKKSTILNIQTTADDAMTKQLFPTRNPVTNSDKMNQKSEIKSWTELLPQLKVPLKVFVYRENPFLNWMLLFQENICTAALSHDLPIKGLDETPEMNDVLEAWKYHIHSDDLHLATTVTSQRFRESIWYTEEIEEATVFIAPLLLNLFFAVEVNMVSCALSMNEIASRTVGALTSYPHFERTAHLHYFSLGHYGYRGLAANTMPPDLYALVNRGIANVFENSKSAPSNCTSPALYIPFPCSHPQASRLPKTAPIIAGVRLQPFWKSPQNRDGESSLFAAWEACIASDGKDCESLERTRPIKIGFRGAIDHRAAYSARREYCTFIAKTLMGTKKGFAATCISTSPVQGTRKRRVSYFNETCVPDQKTVACVASGSLRAQYNYCAELQSSQFTAFHRGDSSTSSRFAEIVLSGSIPWVFITDDFSTLFRTRLVRGVPWHKLPIVCDLRRSTVTHESCLEKLLKLSPRKLQAKYNLSKAYAPVLDYWVEDGVPALVFALHQLLVECPREKLPEQ